MKVLWTPEADQDRRTIRTYITKENPFAAVRMDRLFLEAAADLAHFPQRGPTGLVPGTRELIPHANYRLVYEVEEDTVWILALVHAAQQWPPLP